MNIRILLGCIFITILASSCLMMDIESERTGGLKISEFFDWSISEDKLITIRTESTDNCLIQIFNRNDELIASGIARKDYPFKTALHVANITKSYVAKCYWPDDKISYETISFNESDYTECNFLKQYASDNHHGLNMNVDTDNDMVPDDYDQFPNDNTVAFTTYYPSKEMWATLAFEDLWPYMDDSDYNDLVVYFNFETLTNADNYVIEIIGHFTFPAIGASYQNGLGIQFDKLNHWDLRSATGNIFSEEDFITQNGSGLEADQSRPVVIVTDNVEESVHRNHEGAMMNTLIDGGTGWSDTIHVRIKLTTPLTAERIGAAPFNPFLIRDGARNIEVHLPNYVPTDEVNTSNFGTSKDNTDPESGRYYLTKYNVPWAYLFPLRWKWPREKDDIINAYPDYARWAESDGLEYQDWYLEPSSEYEGPWK